MAGVEDNTNILEGMNQVIKAVNDLVLSSSTTLNCGGCGTEPPSDPGEEGEAPPPGWQDLDDAPGTPDYQERKCKVANLIHENYTDWMTLWKAYSVDTYTAGSVTVLITLLGTLLGLLALPMLGLIAGAVIGFYAGLALVIIAGGFDLDNLLILLGTEEEDLVCALYNSNDAQTGKDNYIQTLSDAGASAGTLALLEAAIAINAMNLLYFRKDGQDAVEAMLDGYSGPVDCDTACICLYDVDVVSGTLLGVVGDVFEFDSEEDWTGCYRVHLHWNGIRYQTPCGPEVKTTIITLTGYTPGDCSGFWKDYTYRGDPNETLLYEGDTEQTDLCYRTIHINSFTPFNVTIQVFPVC